MDLTGHEGQNRRWKEEARLGVFYQAGGSDPAQELAMDPL